MELRDDPVGHIDCRTRGLTLSVTPKICVFGELDVARKLCAEQVICRRTVSEVAAN